MIFLLKININYLNNVTKTLNGVVVYRYIGLNAYSYSF